jgi:hypothetical protein
MLLEFIYRNEYLLVLIIIFYFDSFVNIAIDIQNEFLIQLLIV